MKLLISLLHTPNDSGDPLLQGYAPIRCKKSPFRSGPVLLCVAPVWFSNFSAGPVRCYFSLALSNPLLFLRQNRSGAIGLESNILQEYAPVRSVFLMTLIRPGVYL